MGTTLTGTTPQDTYDSLIKVTDNGPLSATAKYLSDGLGNDSILALSTTAVGLGTATPNALLTLKGTTPFIRIERTGVPTWQIQNNTIVSTNGFSINNITAATTPFFIDGTSGNVGIGTGSPTSILHARRAGNGNVLTVANDQTGSQVNIGVGVVSDGRPFLGTNNNSNPLEVGTQAASDMIFLRQSTEIARITANGLTFNGDTAAANALDDYEEGTWTATLTDGTVTKTATCSYTKIGRVVYIAGGISNAEDPSSFTGSVYVTGVPFTPAFSVSLYGFNNYVSTASIFVPYLESNQVIRFYKVGAASADNVQMQGSDLDFYSDIYFSGQFTV